MFNLSSYKIRLINNIILKEEAPPQIESKD